VKIATEHAMNQKQRAGELPSVIPTGRQSKQCKSESWEHALNLWSLKFVVVKVQQHCSGNINPLNAELIPICHLLALLEAHHILHVSRIGVK
jgi:hypothetical protein